MYKGPSFLFILIVPAIYSYISYTCFQTNLQMNKTTIYAVNIKSIRNAKFLMQSMSHQPMVHSTARSPFQTTVADTTVIMFSLICNNIFTKHEQFVRLGLL